MARKKGRPKAGREPLDRELILEKAMALVDEKGLEALSMRRLAALLEVDPMALYHHIPGKPALLAALIDKVMGGLTVPDLPRSGWKEKVRAFARAYRKLALAHPNLVLPLVSDPEASGRAALAAGEGLYAALDMAGLRPIQVVRAADLIVDYLHGMALAERQGPLDRPEPREEFRKNLAETGKGRYPALEKTYAALPRRIPATGFDSGLDILLLGIEALRSQGGSEG